MKNKTLVIVAIITCILFTGCQNKVLRVKFNVFLIKNLEVKETDDLPQEFKNLLRYEEMGDSSVFPSLKLIRLDYSKPRDYELVIEHTTENKIRTIGGIIPGDNFLILKSDLEEAVPELKAGKILSEAGEIGNSQIEHKKYDAKFIISDDIEKYGDNEFRNIDELRAYLFGLLKKGGKTEFNILYSSNSSGGGGGGGFTNPEYSKIQSALMDIRDFSKSEDERMRLASSVWDEFFAPNAYIQINKPIVQQWPQGKGINYLYHLAALNSISDLKIELVQKDANTNKISGLHIYEVHN